MMKVAIIGSRSIKTVDIGKIIPEGTPELISGGAIGVDICVREYAEANSIPLTVTRNPPRHSRLLRAQQKGDGLPRRTVTLSGIDRVGQRVWPHERISVTITRPASTRNCTSYRPYGMPYTRVGSS